jgi:hypothetical protein
MISQQCSQNKMRFYCQKVFININLINLLSFNFLLKIYTNH